MSELLTQDELRIHYGIHTRQLQEVMKRVGLEPKYTRKSGPKGLLLLFDEEEAHRLLGPVLPVKEKTPVVEARAELDVAEITIPLTRIRETVGAVEAELEKLRLDLEPVLKKLTDQNAVLFRMLEKLLPPSTKSADELAPSPTSAPAVKKETPGPPKLRRVAIVGLHPNQVPHIKKEFEEVFDLRFVNVDDAKGSAFKNSMSYCDHVFTIVNFISHSVEEAVKASGAPFSRVVGGMSTLRTALTDLWVKYAEMDKKATAA